ncbi:MAG: hypothetical protein ACLUVF_08330 [Adlercreutzia sp.]
MELMEAAASAALAFAASRSAERSVSPASSLSAAVRRLAAMESAWDATALARPARAVTWGRRLSGSDGAAPSKLSATWRYTVAWDASASAWARKSPAMPWPSLEAASNSASTESDTAPKAAALSASELLSVSAELFRASTVAGTASARPVAADSVSSRAVEAWVARSAEWRERSSQERASEP